MQAANITTKFFELRREFIWPCDNDSFPEACVNFSLKNLLFLDMRTPAWTELYLAMFKKVDSMYVHRSGGDGLDPNEIEF